MNKLKELMDDENSKTGSFLLFFYYRRYKYWQKLIHHFGYHHAPKMYPPQPYEPRAGIDGKPITEWFHWCQWCGLRGATMEIPPTKKPAEK